jgi:Na+-translocating ferredoxin:NAD+ oxidoreductase subunit B
MEKYEALRQMLHAHPSGAPKSEFFDEILRTLFSPEEVDAALCMRFTPRSIPAIAQAAGLPEEEVRARCESMANKGIAFCREKGGGLRYALLPTIPGLFEFPLMRGGGTSMHERLGRLWQEYHRAGMGHEFAASQTPLARVIPVEETVTPDVEVLPYEQLSRMLDGVKAFALAECACRVSVGGCDKPRDMCLIFDATAEFLVHRGFAQRITRAQAEQVLHRAEEAALVHTTNNSQDRLNFVCNCCPCCCTILRGLTELHLPNAFARSRWRAQVDADLCLGCGVCEEERCPVGAVHVADGVAQVDQVHCIGCGLCATACQAGAISMQLRAEPVPEPPATVAEMGIRVAAEKGRLDDFLPLVAR